MDCARGRGDGSGSFGGDGFAECAKVLRVGNGLDESSQMGPMANPRRPEAMDQLGLAAHAWTNNPARQKRLAREVETGMFCLNTTMLGGSDAPFGGVKWSGQGHEEGSVGVMACLVLKAIHEG